MGQCCFNVSRQSARTHNTIFDQTHNTIFDHTTTEVDENENVCSICIESFESFVRPSMEPVSLRCGHTFHSGCIDRWYTHCVSQRLDDAKSHAANYYSLHIPSSHRLTNSSSHHRGSVVVCEPTVPCPICRTPIDADEISQQGGNGCESIERCSLSSSEFCCWC
jgi:hypothetical protein